ncbi:MAG TPA: hypothetical protein VES01_06915 [Dermatophilaceae bacterium]|nr:hypothetical protein [Dermatophilaceae bacterium]
MPFEIAGNLNGPATYLDWGWLGISVTNLVIVLVTVAVFVLAVLLPFPHHDKDE